LTLKREPHRARSTFGAARAAELAGEREAAVTSYRAYVALMAPAEGKHQELAIAKAYLH